MTPLQKTLAAIVSALNATQQVRTVDADVDSADGTASVDLAALLPDGARGIVVSSVTPDRDTVAAHWSRDGGVLSVQIVSNGVHFTPQPWDASASPVRLHVGLAFTPSPISVPDAPDLSSSGLAHFGTDLPGKMEHVVTHNMGRTRFVERMVDTEGRAHFASVEALNSNQVAVMLAEAVPVRLDLIFMPDDTGQGA